jgi:hypothetical protein
VARVGLFLLQTKPVLQHYAPEVPIYLLDGTGFSVGIAGLPIAALWNQD